MGKKYRTINIRWLVTTQNTCKDACWLQQVSIREPVKYSDMEETVVCLGM